MGTCLFAMRYRNSMAIAVMLKTNPDKPWTYDEDTKLLALWSEGKSFTDIAAALPNRTRNACIARSNRNRKATG